MSAVQIVEELLNKFHSLTDITAIGELVPSAILAATPAVDHDGISALRARKVGSLLEASVIPNVPKDSSKPNLAAKSAITTVKLATVSALFGHILANFLAHGMNLPSQPLVRWHVHPVLHISCSTAAFVLSVSVRSSTTHRRKRAKRATIAAVPVAVPDSTRA